MTAAGGYSRTAHELTPRMRQVLICAAAGRTITATALELGIAEGTVRVIRAAIVARTSSPNLTAAVYRYGRGEL